MAYKSNLHGIGCAALMLSLAVLPTSAIAGGFTGEGASNWVATARALAEAASSGPDKMGAACVDFGKLTSTSKEAKTEYMSVAKWAFTAHQWTCFAYNAYASRERGKGFMTSTRPCDNLDTAVKELGKAQPGVDPDDVVAAAGQLKTALTSLSADLKAAKSCKLQPVRLF